MKLNELVVGKTIVGVEYISYELVRLSFSDGTELNIHQTSQTGELELFYGDQEVTADDRDEED